MDRILKEWENDLEKHVSSFVKHSQQIKHWDQVIFQNSTKVLQLQNEVANVMESQMQLDVTLEKIRVFYYLFVFIYFVLCVTQQNTKI